MNARVSILMEVDVKQEQRSFECLKEVVKRPRQAWIY